MTEPLSLPSRFSLVLDGLYRTVGARSRSRMLPLGLEGSFALLICVAIRRIDQRFQWLATRILAGRLNAEHEPRGRVHPPRPARHPATPPPRRLPRGFAWLIRLVPYEAACHAHRVRLLLEEAEMRAIIAASPRVWRCLRRLCRMLGIEESLLGPPPAPKTGPSRVRATRRMAPRVETLATAMPDPVPDLAPVPTPASPRTRPPFTPAATVARRDRVTPIPDVPPGIAIFSRA